VIIQQLIINGFISGGIYALVAVGFAIIYRAGKFFHLAHGAAYTVAAYLAHTTVMLWLSVFGSMSVHGWLVAVIVGVIGASATGVAIDRFVYHPLRKQNASNLTLLIASFGVLIFVQNLIQLVYGAQPLSMRFGSVKEGYRFIGAVITDIQILIIAVSCFLMFGSWWLLQGTKRGKAIRAVSDDPVAANIVGINPDRIILYSFLTGSALAGIAGILISFETNLEPTMGFTAVLKGIVASIVGGVGNVPGAVLGGFFLGLVENLGIWKIQAEWKDAISFGILIMFLTIRPLGFMGTRTERESL